MCMKYKSYTLKLNHSQTVKASKLTVKYSNTDHVTELTRLTPTANWKAKLTVLAQAELTEEL